MLRQSHSVPENNVNIGLILKRIYRTKFSYFIVSKKKIIFHICNIYNYYRNICFHQRVLKSDVSLATFWKSAQESSVMRDQ